MKFLPSLIQNFISDHATFHTRSYIVILFINTQFGLLLHRDVECLLYDLFSNKPYALLCMIYCKCKKRCGHHFCFLVSWHYMCHWSSYHGSSSHNQRPNTDHPYHRNLYNCCGCQLQIWPNYLHIKQISTLCCMKVEVQSK